MLILKPSFDLEMVPICSGVFFIW